MTSSGILEHLIFLLHKKGLNYRLSLPERELELKIYITNDNINVGIKIEQHDKRVAYMISGSLDSDYSLISKEGLIEFIENMGD